MLLFDLWFVFLYFGFWFVGFFVECQLKDGRDPSSVTVT